MIRRRSGVRRAGLGVLLCLLAVPAATTGTAAAAAAAPSGVAVGGWSAAGAGRFWTPARMRSAVPVEVAGPGAGEAEAEAARAPWWASASGAPKPVAPHSDFAEVSDPTSEVSRVNGVIFFEFNGELGRCSGTSVEAPNMSVVFTAGHCVHEVTGSRGQWYRGRWTFVPGYRFGQRPFGVFPAKWLDATTRWVSEGNENFDVAAAVVGRNEKGQTLAAAVGADHIAFDLPADQAFDVHGYPVGGPFDGETQRLCEGVGFLGHDPESVISPGPLTLAVPCQVTGGASGGGWTIHGDVLNGVTDYGYPEDPETDYGAYFGPEVRRLYQRVARFK
jgi:V8-like Glu-specific endopeptidase